MASRNKRARLSATVERGAQGDGDASRDAESRAAIDLAMDRYASGQDDAFVLVYDGIAPRLLGYLLRHTHDRDDAEDLVQQTMLHIHRSRGSFIRGAEVVPWAFAIARRLLVDRLRHREPGRRVDNAGLDARASEAPGADDLFYARQMAGHIESALARLPPAQREAFQLIKQEGLSLGDAARILGTTVGAAKLRLHRAYDALRAAMADAERFRRGAR